MKISTRGRYALKFMIDLANQNKEIYIPLKDISERQGISIKYLEQITGLLSKFGLLLAVRGPQGGYKLARNPDKYTVGEILRITEGDLSPVDYNEPAAEDTARKENEATIKIWKGLEKVINDYLDSITLDQLLVNEETLNYCI